MDMTYDQISKAIAAGQQTDTSYVLRNDKVPEIGTIEYEKLVGPISSEKFHQYKGQIR